MIIETYMNNLNEECGIADDFDFNNLDNYTRLFVNNKNQIYFGMIVNYYGDIQVVNLMTGEFGFFDPEILKNFSFLSVLYAHSTSVLKVT